MNNYDVATVHFHLAFRHWMRNTQIWKIWINIYGLASWRSNQRVPTYQVVIFWTPRKSFEVWPPLDEILHDNKNKYNKNSNKWENTFWKNGKLAILEFSLLFKIFILQSNNINDMISKSLEIITKAFISIFIFYSTADLLNTIAIIRKDNWSLCVCAIVKDKRKYMPQLITSK